MTKSDAKHAAPAPRRGPLSLGILLGAVALVASCSPGDTDTAPRSVPTTSGLVVTVPAGASIQAAVEANPDGTTFQLEPGTYRTQQVTPRPGDVFQGAGTDTVLNGAVIVDGWQRTDATWSATGFTAAGEAHGVCRPEAPRCDRPDELFLDGVRLGHVAALDEVTSGAWWFDYDSETIHTGDDPEGHLLELATIPFAFGGDADGVVIRDLTVTHYATPAQRGAVNVEGNDLLIERVTAEENHALGIFFSGDGVIVRDSTARRNGQLGLGASGATDAVVERVELAENNQAGFNDEWEGGGAKFTLTDKVRITGSFVHNNDGAGIWFDESAQDSLIEGNRSIDNSGAGIFYEISKEGTITGNTVTGNGFGEASRGWLWGAGIQIAGSWDVTVLDNLVSGNFNAVTVIQQDRGSGPFGDRQVADIVVRGNTVDPGDGLIGMATDVTDSNVFDRSVTFNDNGYEVSATARSFVWDGDEIDEEAWTALGQS